MHAVRSQDKDAASMAGLSKSAKRPASMALLVVGLMLAVVAQMPAAAAHRALLDHTGHDHGDEDHTGHSAEEHAAHLSLIHI